MQSLRQYQRLGAKVEPHARSYRENGVSEDAGEEHPSTEGSAANSTASSNAPLTNKRDSESSILVDWDGDHDPEHPRNWSLKYKLWVSFIVYINVFVLDWCSSANSQAGDKIAAELGVSDVAKRVASACYVFGIATGALISGPVSEIVGRNPIYIGSRLSYLAFILGTALAKNLGMQIPFRFLAGLGASIILAIHGASIADMFDAKARSLVWPFIASASFLGTAFSPVPGGWIAKNSHISWRWCDWIAFCMSGVTFSLTFFTLPETFAPVLLYWKAHHMRKLTGNDRFMAELECQHPFHARLMKNLQRGVIMATQEYIVILLGLWLVVVYVIIFGFLQGIEFLFGGTYGFDDGLVGICFCAIAVGLTLSVGISPFYARYHGMQTRKFLEENPDRAKPPPEYEYRMVPALPLGLSLAIGLFWLGWTNYASISPWSGLGAVALYGFSWAGIYTSIYMYIFDVYSIYAGTALSSITTVRCLWSPDLFESESDVGEPG